MCEQLSSSFVFNLFMKIWANREKKCNQRRVVTAKVKSSKQFHLLSNTKNQLSIQNKHSIYLRFDYLLYGCVIIYRNSIRTALSADYMSFWFSSDGRIHLRSGQRLLALLLHQFRLSRRHHSSRISHQFDDCSGMAHGPWKVRPSFPYPLTSNLSVDLI